MKTIDLDPTLRTDPRFGRQRFSAKAAYIEMYMYAASTENWGMFSATIEDIAWILGRGNEIDLMQKDIDALVGAGLLIAHPDGSIEISGFREIQQRIIENRDYYKRLQASRRAKTEQPLPSDTEPDNNNNNVSNTDVTCNNNVSNVSVDCITKPNLTKPNLTKPNLTKPNVAAAESKAPKSEPTTPPQKSPAKISNPPPASKSKADSRSSHPAILAIKQVTNRMPPIVTYDLIIKAIGSEPDTEKLAQCFAQWSARGFNPQNLSGVLDWYSSGIPERNKPTAQTARQTKGDLQMSNLRAGLAAFMEES